MHSQTLGFVDSMFAFVVVVVAVCLLFWFLGVISKWYERSAFIQRITRMPPVEEARDFEYEASTAALRAIDAWECDHIPEAMAKVMAGPPDWKIEKLCTLRLEDIKTMRDVERWDAAWSEMTIRLDQTRSIIDRRRRALLPRDSEELIPAFLRRQAD